IADARVDVEQNQAFGKVRQVEEVVSYAAVGDDPAPFLDLVILIDVCVVAHGAIKRLDLHLHIIAVGAVAANFDPLANIFGNAQESLVGELSGVNDQVAIARLAGQHGRTEEINVEVQESRLVDEREFFFKLEKTEIDR